MAGVYILYSVTLAALLAVSLPFWLVQMLRLGKYRAGLAERLGRVPARLAPSDGTTPTVWIHAVSVGEALAVAPLVEALRAEGWRVAISTTTHTGQKLARAKYGEHNVFYFPLDFALCIRPYLRRLRPHLVVLAETEFWPNFLREAAKSGAKVAVVNARISDRSLPRYRRFRALLATVLEPVSLFLAQSELDARRLKEVGASPERVEVAGNLKFDVAPPVESAEVTRLGLRLRESGAPIVVAGSTVEGEEELVVKAFRQVLAEHPAASLVLAPRHKERFAEVAQLLSARGVPFVRRSEGAAERDLRGQIVLLDTLGELASIYRYANIAFVGGSLVPRGGHNILEPAFFSRPILTGPHTENFRDILRCFEAHRAVERVNARDFGMTMLLLLREEQARESMGQRAFAVLAAERGATARTLARLHELEEGGAR